MATASRKAGSQGPKAFEEKLAFFPYGTQYHRAPTPLPAEWEGDMKELAARGYTHLQYRPQWRWHERIRGQATWDDLDRLFDLAARHKLRVVLKPMLETAPDWAFTELGGTRIGFDNVPLLPFAHGACYVGGWWPCFDNAGVVQAASEFVGTMARRYKDHPALWFYDAWNEPRSWPLGQCQCVHSKASYRQWLRSRYGTIEALNEKFGKAWTSFETLDPPCSAADYVEIFLWRQWAAFAVSQQVRFVSGAIKQAHPEAHVMVHIGGATIIQDIMCSTSDDLLNRAAGVDRYGTSFPIPLHPADPLAHAAPELISSWLRRVDDLYWCHEFYPNHAQWCLPPDQPTLRRLIWMAIAGGASGFTFWQFRSERVGCETNGFGLRNIDGSPTPRSEVADSIAACLKRHGKALVGSKRPRGQVGILYSRDSDMMSRIAEMPYGITSIAHEQDKGGYYPYKRAMAGAHAMYHWLGLDGQWIVPGDDLAGFKLLHVTLAEMIDQECAQWLTEFVRKGGRLIVEFPLACRDERTWVTHPRPTYGLEELLGCRESDRLIADKALTFTLDGGQTALRAGPWRTTFTPLGSAKVIGAWPDGSVAAVRHTFGKGEVVSLGGNISFGYAQANTWDATEIGALGELAAGLGVALPRWARTGLVYQRRIGPNGTVHFVMNCSAQPRQIELDAARPTVIDQEGAALTGGTLSLEPGGVWVGRACDQI